MSIESRNGTDKPAVTALHCKYPSIGSKAEAACQCPDIVRIEYGRLTRPDILVGEYATYFSPDQNTQGLFTS